VEARPLATTDRVYGKKISVCFVLILETLSGEFFSAKGPIERRSEVHACKKLPCERDKKYQLTISLWHEKYI
jgi:hypothetical protein